MTGLLSDAATAVVAIGLGAFVALLVAIVHYARKLGRAIDAANRPPED